MQRVPRTRVAAVAAPSRRTLVFAGAGLLGAAGVLLAGRAKAFSMVDADRETARAYQAACGANRNDHAKTVEEARDLLRKAGKSEDEIAASDPVGCPTCGCKLALSFAPGPAPFLR